MAHRTTMADIAKAAGVSASTVSRALNNHPSIPEQTRSLIRGLASDLNYRLDVQARNFRLGQTMTIATLLSYQGPSHRRTSDPFYLEIFGAITDELDHNGYNSLIARINLSDPDWYARYQLDKQVDGLILIDRPVDSSQLTHLQDSHVHFVVWGSPLPYQPFISVGCDGEQGAYDGVRHLVSIGRRQIGFIGGFEGMVETAARLNGYRKSLLASGIEPHRDWVCFTDFTPAEACDAALQLLKANPQMDGILACSDYMAVAVMEALRRFGKSVPQQVAVVGYDDIPLASYCSPRLTTVRQPIQEGARIMVDRLLSLLNGDVYDSVVLPHELVIRDSCGANIRSFDSPNA